jgi:hypothetical protein
VEALRQKLAAVQAELTSEQAARRRAEEGRAKADSDRSRLQRQRDEAHAQLRVRLMGRRGARRDIRFNVVWYCIYFLKFVFMKQTVTVILFLVCIALPKTHASTC